MARIRSIHPGQWVDDQFVTSSPLARLLSLALRNFADDNGAFEWNPVKIRLLCLPGDNCEIADLLAELVATGQVKRYDVAGKAYGLIRNFAKFQSPKKPRAYHPLPAEEMGDGYETPYEPETNKEHQVRNRFGTGGENRRQREKEKESPLVPQGETPPVKNAATRMMEIWNTEAPPEVPRVRKVSEARARKLSARLAEDLGGDLEQWRALVRSLGEMPLLVGKAGSGWVASLDWLAEPRNIAKVLEGNYRRPGSAPRPRPPEGPVPWGDRHEWQAVQGHVLRYADPDDVAAWQAAAERWREGRDPEGAVVELRRIAKRCGAAA